MVSIDSRSKPQAEAPISAQVAEHAVEWLIELQAEPVAAETLAQWRQWRAAHPDHERAWQRIEAVNGQLSYLAAPENLALAHATLAPRGTKRRRQAIKTLSGLMLGTGALWLLEENVPWRELSADERTAIGERRDLTLADGTHVTLNTDSALDVRYGSDQRRLRLMAGEILIATASDAMKRAFVLDSPHGEVRALGTRFSVRVFAATTTVRVLEGAVNVAPRQKSGAGQRLQAGQQLSFRADSWDTAQPTDADALAWIDGFIVAKSWRLADFLLELGRYSKRSLSCDTAVADLRVSGSYPVDDVGRVLDAVATTLSLRVETVDRFWGQRAVRLAAK